MKIKSNQPCRAFRGYAQGLKANLAVSTNEIRAVFFWYPLFTLGSPFVRNYQVYLPPEMLIISELIQRGNKDKTKFGTNG